MWGTLAAQQWALPSFWPSDEARSAQLAGTERTAQQRPCHSSSDKWQQCRCTVSRRGSVSRSVPDIRIEAQHQIQLPAALMSPLSTCSLKLRSNCLYCCGWQRRWSQWPAAQGRRRPGTLLQVATNGGYKAGWQQHKRPRRRGGLAAAAAQACGAPESVQQWLCTSTPLRSCCSWKSSTCW